MENNYNNIVGIKFARALQPKFEEKKGKGWIEFGEENNYPLYLLGLFNESAKHGSIIKGKSNYIFGKGLDGVPIKANIVGESYNQILKKAILDDEIFGGYYLQIIYNLTGQIKDVYHLEYHKVRTNKDGSEFYVKDNWQDNREQSRQYPAFNPTQYNTQPSQVLFVKQYNPKGSAYPLPSYFSSLNYIDADVQVSRHILGNAVDGFVPGTLINLNGGEPSEEAKHAVERGIKKKFTGSEGDRVVIMFNSSKDNAAEIQSLNQTMLTKEDFTNINNLIQTEIFSGAQITSPALFGIATPGALGQRNELRDAYEIFNNTYVSERQQAFEQVFNKLLEYAGAKGEYVIIPVEPLGFEFSEAIVSQNLTKDEIREIMGKEPLDTSVKTQAQIISDNINSLSPLVANKVLESMTPDEIRSLAGLIPKGQNVIGDGSMPPPPPSDSTMSVNSNIANMTGRQFQHLERIKRKYQSGKMTKAQAVMMLKSSFGLSDADVEILLMDSEGQQFKSQAEFDAELIEAFENEYETLEGCEIMSVKPARMSQYFAEVKQLDQLESDVLNLVKKDNKVTAEVIADTLGVEVPLIEDVLKSFASREIIKVRQSVIGSDKIVERIPIKDIKIEAPKPGTTSFQLRYTYGWKDVVPPNERDTTDHPSRPFCKEMKRLAQTKVWSRANIENLSIKLCYSVFDRLGGFWNDPRNPDEFSCRHEWKTVIIKKTL